MNKKQLEQIANASAEWVGSTTSIIVHTIIFIAIFALALIGVQLSSILLILTTLVSLEAIYLSIFVQMTVNKHSKHLRKLSTKKKSK